MALATNDEEIVDAEVVEDFNVDDVLKPRPVREVEVYAGPDDSTARANLHQAGEIERGNRWSIARLIACSVEPQQGQRRDLGNFGESSPKLSMNDAESEYGKDRKTIRSYLSAWNAAARDGLCVPSDELSPEDGWTTPMPDPEDWQHYKAEASKPKAASCEGCHSEYAVASLNDTNVGPLCNECYDNRLEAKSFAAADWPEVPEPDDYTEPTPEEKVQRFEETRQRLIDQGLIPRPRTQEEDDAAAERFVQSLTGQTPPRTRTPETPEAKLKTLLNEISKLLTEGATLDNLDGLTEAGREAYAKLTKEI